jgi:hypothetical protein
MHANGLSSPLALLPRVSWDDFRSVLLVLSPWTLMLAIAGSFMLRPQDHGGLFVLIFAISCFIFLLGAGQLNGTAPGIFDFPLRYLAFFAIMLIGRSSKHALWIRLGLVLLLCAWDVQQFYARLF